MRTSILFSSAVGLFCSLSTAQTPPGYDPSTSTLLPVQYGTNSFTPGEHLALNSTASAPTISFPPSSLVVMLDLDAPFAAQNRSFSPFLHWITTSSNQSVVAYGGPQPPEGSPDHRYVFLAYSLPSNTTGAFVMPTGFEEVGSTIESRAIFDLKGFVDGSGLKGLISANWFTVSTASAPNANETTSEPEPYEGVSVRTASVGSFTALLMAFGATIAGYVL